MSAEEAGRELRAMEGEDHSGQLANWPMANGQCPPIDPAANVAAAVIGVVMLLGAVGLAIAVAMVPAVNGQT